MTSDGFHWRIKLTVPDLLAPFVDAVLEPVCDAIALSLDEKTRLTVVEGFTTLEPDRALIQAALTTALGDELDPVPQPSYDLIPPKNWLAENLMDFPPLRIGRFFIHGSHIEEPLPLGTIPLKLDAGTAFGSGQHGSTAGCLAGLEWVAKRRTPRTILDMGCGSGILGIAAAKLWGAPVIASDIDDEAVRVTLKNADENGVGNLISATQGIGYRSELVRRGAPYDLIVANILARPIRRLSRDLGRHLAPNGYVVLSGLLMRDAEMVLSAHRHQGLYLARKLRRVDWLTLILRG